jgi:hypothetical protein
MAEKTRGTDMEGAVRLALARRVAERDVPDEIVGSVVDRISSFHEEVPVRRLDICAYGICLDYFIDVGDWPDRILRLLDLGSPFRKFEIFPYGILVDDLLHVHIEHRFDELVPYTSGVAGEESSS